MSPGSRTSTASRPCRDRNPIERIVALLVIVLSGVLAGCAGAPHAAEPRYVATAKSEQSANNLVERGKAFDELGDRTRAEQYFAAAIAAGADAQKVMPMLLRVCVKDGRYRAAAAYADEHARTHPKDVRVRYLSGVIHSSLDENEAARAQLESAISLEPSHARAHVELAQVLERLGDHLGADQHRREYLRLLPNAPDAAEVRARLLRRGR